MKLILPLILIAWSGNAQSSILGKWKTVDESGEEKSIIEIFERDGKVHGKIVKIFTQENPDPICDVCPEDDRVIGKKSSEWKSYRTCNKVIMSIVEAPFWIHRKERFIGANCGWKKED